MRILWLDAFHGGSHAAVARGYASHSAHEVELLTLSIAGGWRWRMRGAAVTLARELRRLADARFDLIVATDMLDLATFLGLTRDLTASVPVALYMHENQLTYPLPPGRTRDLAYPWINYTAALAADALLFNSDFHRREFLAALPGLPGRYHDHRELDLLDVIAGRSEVLPPGIALAQLDLPADEPAPRGADGGPPVLLWNSRWEYDKGPEAFFAALEALDGQGADYRVIVVGEHVDPDHPAFLAARERLAARALAWGYAADPAAYRRLLHTADIVVSTAIQEFFGIAVVEALYCGCVPLLPNRLSYPEILPPAAHAACLYDGPQQLVERLLAMPGMLPALRAHDFRAIAAAYDWRQMAPRYDATLSRIARRRKS